MQSISLICDGKSYKQSARWSILGNELDKFGFALHDENDFDADFKIFVDIPHQHLTWIQNYLDLKNCFLILTEPPSVNPQLYYSELLGKFAAVFSYSRQISTKYKTRFIQFPVTDIRFGEVSKMTEDRLKRIGLINANKNSFVKGELYSLRRSILSNLARRNVEVYVAGKDWSRNRFDFVREDMYLLKKAHKSRKTVDYQNFRLSFKLSNQVKYCGIVEDKYSFLDNIGIVLCIENDLDHFSEKIFDVIQSGAIPIYVGPNLEDNGIPAELAIQVSSNVNEILLAIDEITIERAHAIHNAGQNWIASRAQNWNMNQGMLDIAIALKYEINLLNSN